MDDLLDTLVDLGMKTSPEIIVLGFRNIHRYQTVASESKIPSKLIDLMSHLSNEVPLRNTLRLILQREFTDNETCLYAYNYITAIAILKFMTETKKEIKQSLNTYDRSIYADQLNKLINVMSRYLYNRLAPIEAMAIVYVGIAERQREIVRDRQSKSVLGLHWITRLWNRNVTTVMDLANLRKWIEKYFKSEENLKYVSSLISGK